MHDALRRTLGSVRFRVTVAATLVFGVAFALASVVLVRTVETRLEDRAEDDGRLALRRVVQQLEQGQSASGIVVESGTPVFTCIIGARGDVLYGTECAPPLPRYAGEPSGEAVYGVSSMGDVVLFTQRVAAPDGPVTVAVASPLENAQRSAAAFGRGLWWLTAILTLGVGALAWFIAGRALRPVEAIRSEVLAISGATMHRRVPVPTGRDEVRRLAETMNEMLDRLERASNRQREFVSDASHELRSPVAAMRTDLEVALRDPQHANWPALAHRLLAENERLGALVDDLLELARLEEGIVDTAHTTVDLDELVLTDVEQRPGPLRYDTTAVSGGRVDGSVRQYAQVVRNLIDNAARHARTAVAVGVTTDDDEVVLSVEDDGPGIADEDRARVFERFTRLDAARARDGGGSGLGLAVVKRIVDAHHGTVQITNGSRTGARFEVRLPRSR
jgi:signal transduction histidine kinase